MVGPLGNSFCLISSVLEDLGKKKNLSLLPTCVILLQSSSVMVEGYLGKSQLLYQWHCSSQVEKAQCCSGWMVLEYRNTARVGPRPLHNGFYWVMTLRGFVVSLWVLAMLSSMQDIKSLVREVPTLVSAPQLPCLNKFYLVHIILKIRENQIIFSE